MSAAGTSALHFHALVLDGVYAEHEGRPVFHEAEPLSDEEVARLTRTIHDRVLRHLRRRGRLPGDPAADVCAPDEPLLVDLAAASVEGRVALGPRAGSRLERVASEPRSTRPFVPGALCSAFAGFSLQAHVRVGADERDRLERLCRYIARPPIATERLSLAPGGKVVLRRPFRDGTTHVVFDPLTFLERDPDPPRPSARAPVRRPGAIAPGAPSLRVAVAKVHRRARWG